jgi:6-phosphogluconolactonase (cycloisomerase 2 family)
MARKGLVAAAVAVATLVSGGAALAATGELSPRGCIGDNDTGLDTCGQSTDGLGIVYSVAVSADGRSVYAASQEDSAIALLMRNRTTGALTPVGCIDDNDIGPDTCAQSTDGLDTATSVAVSADGRSVYAASFFDDAIVHLKRTRTTGALTPAGCIDDNDTGPDTCDPSTDGLDGASSVAVSADGRSVYVASIEDDAIVRFRRNRTTGALKRAGCIDDNDSGTDTCGRSTNGLNGPSSVAVSADGRSVYVASDPDDAIVRFRRNRTTGALKPGGCVDDNDTGPDTCARSTDGLNGANSVAVSADGRSVYAASFLDDAIVRFRREN